MNEPELMPVAKRREQKFKLGIIGYGYVGKAVDYIFSTPTVEKMTIDPKYNENTLKDLCDWNPSCVFICLPTPSKEDGSVDSKDIDEDQMEIETVGLGYSLIDELELPIAAEPLDGNQSLFFKTVYKNPARDNSKQFLDREQ